MAIDVDLTAKIIAVVVAPGSVIVLGWWLRSQFADLKDAATANLAQHEVKDQERHEQNLAKFEKINITLARMGWRNGGDNGYSATR